MMDNGALDIGTFSFLDSDDDHLCPRSELPVRANKKVIQKWGRAGTWDDDGSTTTATDDASIQRSTLESTSSVLGQWADVAEEGDTVDSSNDELAAACRPVPSSAIPTAVASVFPMQNAGTPIAMQFANAGMPIQFPSLPLPGGAAVPSTLTTPQVGMYVMALAPNGAQVLMPVSAAGSPFAQIAAQPVWNAGSVPSRTTTNQQEVGSLEAHAAMLSAHAKDARAAANRAKAAATVARHQRSGRAAESTELEAGNGAASISWDASDDRTTLMFRNLPHSYTRSPVLYMLDSEGFVGTYCFVYVPTDFKSFTGPGYAFVGFCTHEDAVRAKRHYQGFDHWKVPGDSTCDVAWSGPVQGLQQHTERYRNSPVMHPSVPDEYKPAVFVNGMRVPFPAPTKKIRPPRLRHSVAGDVLASSEGGCAGMQHGQAAS